MHAVWATGGDVETEPLIKQPSRTGYTILYSRCNGATGEWQQPLVLARGQHAKLAVTRDGIPLVAWENDGVVSLARLTANQSHPPSTALVSAAGAFPTLAVASHSNDIFVTWQERGGDAAAQVKLARVRVDATDDRR